MSKKQFVTKENVIQTLKDDDYLIVYSKDCGHCLEMLKSISNIYDHFYTKFIKYGSNIYIVSIDMINFEKLLIEDDGKIRLPVYLKKRGNNIVFTKRLPIKSILKPDIVEYY